MRKVIHSPYHTELRRTARLELNRLRERGVLRRGEAALSRRYPTVVVRSSHSRAARDWEVMVAAAKGEDLRDWTLNQRTEWLEGLAEQHDASFLCRFAEPSTTVLHGFVPVGVHSRWSLPNGTCWRILPELMCHREAFTRIFIELAFTGSNTRLIVEWEKP